MKNNAVYSFLLVVMLFACSKDDANDSILTKQKFTSLLIRMHILEAEYTFNQQLDPAFVDKGYKKYKALFKQYETDSVTVSNTFEYYTDHQSELLTIYRDVLDSLNVMAIESQSVKKPK